MYAEYEESICRYLENAGNEVNLHMEFAVRIHSIRRMNLSYSENRRLNMLVYLECAKRIYMYTEYTWNALKDEYLGKFEAKIENILGRLSGLRWVL